MTEAHPDEYDTSADPERQEHFRIHDDGAAAWAMRKLRAVHRRVADIEAIAAAERARIDAWAADATRSHQREVDYFTGLLLDYGRRQRDEEDRKTISTPYGSIRSRAGSLKWTIDPDGFLPWAETNRPDLIRVRKDPDLSAAKKDLKLSDTLDPFDPSTGEAVPGVTVEQTEPTYTVEVDL